MQQLKQNRSRVLEHLITFPWGDVRVIFLLQVSIVLNFVFLIGSKKLPGSPLCRVSNEVSSKLLFGARPTRIPWGRSTRSHGVESVLICDSERISEVPDSSDDALN